jgi:glycine/D-amino acid oxidase-like deaminating enzyme
MVAPSMNHPTRPKFDIAIIGGGILGSATVYFLLKQSPSISVCVIEPDPTYEFASTLRTSGGCRVQFTCPENIAMSLYSIGFIRAFEQAMASDGRPAPVDWVEGGYLFIVPPDNVANLERNVRRQRSEGCVVDLLTPQELKNKFPCCDRQRQNGSPPARG